MIKFRRRLFAFLCFSLLVAAAPLFGNAQQQKQKDPAIPDLAPLVGPPRSETSIVVQRFDADRGNLLRFYNITISPTRHARLKRFCGEWAAALQKLETAKLTKQGLEDVMQLRKRLEGEFTQVDAEAQAQLEIKPLLPFAAAIIGLAESRQQMDEIDPAMEAGVLHGIKKQMQDISRRFDVSVRGDEKPGFKITKQLGQRAADSAAALRTTLRNWYAFYDGYDPAFTWWNADLFKEVDAALERYASVLKDKAPGVTVQLDGIPPLPPFVPSDKSNPRPPSFPVTVSDVPDLTELIALTQSEMRDVVAKFQKDRGAGKGGMQGGPAKGPPSPERNAKVKKLDENWLAALAKLDFDKLSQEGKVDNLLVKNQIEHDLRKLDLQTRMVAATARLLPFEPAIDALDEAVRKGDKQDPAQAERTLTSLNTEIEKAQAAAKAAVARSRVDPNSIVANPVVVAAAIDAIKDFRSSIKKWLDKGATGNPEFAKAVAKPAEAANGALQDYADLLSSTLAGGGKKDANGITGRPIGRDALLIELAAEMIGQSPEELLAIADKEYAWCEAEMKKASRELGYGDDWLKAVEKVKTTYVPPGQQPGMIRDLAWEAVSYLKKHDLVTVPSIAQETWRMQMMTPQRQLVNPFFTGGETISVSYPTNTMSYEARLQSMRGNNPHFSRATAHHELIPGHHLQIFMAARHSTQRRPFQTPFLTEGWALYWEFVLYDKGFPKTSEDRIGFLFWRMHRCARIHFSLNFHLGKWTPQECIDYLVMTVGHERENATAEVRRSFGTGYGPLYQAAYMLGGKQFWAMRKEVVVPGKMSERAFHDAILRAGNMPIEMIRALVTNQKLTPDYRANWKFAE